MLYARSVAVPETPLSDRAEPPERLSAGKALRQSCPRSAHAEWTLPPDRPDPIDLLIENSAGRVPELVPLRYGRMLASPFTFLRGAAAVMASDLSRTPSTGVTVQACGDCHLLNFGGFATAERRVIFDINDFDETSIAPWEWDVKRLVASVHVAGRSNGFSERESRTAVRAAAAGYREQTATYATTPVLDTWYEAFDLERLLERSADTEMRRFYLAKLRSASARSSHEKEFAKLTFLKGERPRIVDRPPLIFHGAADMDQDEFRANVEESYARYLESLPRERRTLLDRYQIVDVAFKVVGIGSVGTVCGVVLLISRNGDPLFLQIKQAGQSVLEPYAGPSGFDHPGERVVVGQRLMQAAGDMFLGWFTGVPAGRQFYVRQLGDAKIKPVIETMNPLNLRNYAGLCGRALARAHSRSGDAALLTGYMGKNSAFDDALADFAKAYADQTEADHAALVAAARSGKVEVQTEE